MADEQKAKRDGYRAFQVCDTNEDGVLDKAELAFFLRGQGVLAALRLARSCVVEHLTHLIVYRSESQPARHRRATSNLQLRGRLAILPSS